MVVSNTKVYEVWDWRASWAKVKMPGNHFACFPLSYVHLQSTFMTITISMDLCGTEVRKMEKGDRVSSKVLNFNGHSRYPSSPLCYQ